MTFPNSIDRFLRNAYGHFHHRFPLPPLKETSWGKDFPDKRFLVIRRYSPSSGGFFSFFYTTLSWIRYADQNGLIPVVDMQYWLNQCLELSEVGKKNAWEFYFKQPGGYTLKDIAHAKNVVIANETKSPCYPSTLDLFAQQDLTDEIRALVQKYIRIKHESLAEFDNPELDAALEDKTVKVIGVRARGTDYNAIRPAGHSIQPTAQHIIEKIAEFPSNYPIYLVSEDRSIVDPLVKEFGPRVILSKQKMPDYKGGWMPDCRTTTQSRFQEGAGYVKAIYDLSRCPIMMGGRNNGTVAAYILSRGFEHFHWFNLGIYE